MSAIQSERVDQMLNEEFDSRVFLVEDDAVWVSGMNQHCRMVAEQMASYLSSNEIPCSLVYDDGATKNSGVQFNYGQHD